MNVPGYMRNMRVVMNCLKTKVESFESNSGLEYASDNFVKNSTFITLASATCCTVFCARIV